MRFSASDWWRFETKGSSEMDVNLEIQAQISLLHHILFYYRSRRINISNNVVPNNSCSHVGGETSLLKSFVVWVFLLALTLLKLFVARRPGLWLILTERTVLCKLISGQTRATSIIHFSLRQWMRCRSVPRYGLKRCSINSWLPDCQSRMKIPLP